MKKGKSIIAGLLLALTIPATVAGVTFTIQNPETVKDWFNGEEIVTTSDHNKQIEELKSELEVYKELLAQVDNDKNKIQELESEISKHKETIQDLQNQLENAQDNELLISDLQEQIVNQETIIADLQNQLELAQSNKAYIAQLEQKISQLEERIAELENQLEDQTGEEEVAPTSASLFTFDGNSCTGYVGENTADKIVIPKSYSTETEFVKSDCFVDMTNIKTETNSSISFIELSDPEGSNTHSYNNTTELINSFDKDFEGQEEVVLLKLQYDYNVFTQNTLKSYLKSIITTPFNYQGVLYNDIDSFLYDHFSSKDLTFGGNKILFVDGNDYQVDSISSNNNKSGFINFNGEIVLLNNIKEIKDYSFYRCSNVTSITIPESIVNIGSYAFSNCEQLTNLIFPDNVTSIGANAFSNCKQLTNIEIPDSVTSIGSYAFLGCDNLIYYSYKDLKYLGNEKNNFLVLMEAEDSSLNTYQIHDNCKIINSSAFEKNSSLTEITIPDSVIEIGYRAFLGCSQLKTVNVGNNVKSIDEYAFFDCSSLVDIVIPNSVTEIGGYVFYGCSNLASLIIPNSVISIGRCAFQECVSLANIEISDSINKLEYQLFLGCTSLSDIKIGNNVTYIDSNVFRGCTSLSNITITDKITYIGNAAFYNCDNLTTITILATTPPTLASTGAISTATTKIYIPSGTLNAYQSATNWSNFADLFEELPA